MKLTYCNDRDIELWVVSESGWAIPVKCQHCVVDEVGYVHVIPAVPLGFAQSGELDRVLTQRGATVLKSGWIIEVSSFTHVATKAIGITPEFYYLWDGCQVPRPSTEPESVKRPKTARKTHESEPFIDHVVATSGINKELLTVAFLAVTQALPGWLLSGNTLSLGAIRLAAVPYRRNWKEIVLARYPTLRKALMVRESKRLLSMAFTAASRIVRLSELTECHMRRGNPLFSWTVEVLHDSDWEKTCDDVEGKAAAQLGSIPYVKRWANRVSQIEETVYEILSAHIQKETAPTCRVLWRRGQRGMQFVQASPTVLGPAPVLECDEGSDSSVDDFLGIEDSAQYLEEKAARLFKMSALQQENDDVRSSRGDDQATGRQPGDSGVLVLHTPSCQITGQGMLAGRDEPQEKLDQ
jgi:hypothetical protein